jgi:hypothetical protein
VGKGNERRSWPAACRVLTSNECGNGRHRRFACPPDCTFNPFAPSNYDEVRRLEERLDEITLDHLAASDRPLARLIAEAWQDEGDLTRAARLNARVVARVFHHPDASGRTLFAAWEADGFPRLKRNDERVYASHKGRITGAILEIREVVDDLIIRAADLLSPPEAPLLEIADRSLAARAVRFETYLGALYPLPHFSRLSGSCAILPEIATWDPRDLAHTLFAHLGAPPEEAAARRWLMTNFDLVLDAIEAVASSLRRRLYEAADIRHVTLDYAPQVSIEECLAELEPLPEVEWEALEADDREDGWIQSRLWLEADKLRPGFTATTPILGRVLARPDALRLEAGSSAAAAHLRRRFEAALGPRVRFVREESEELVAAQLARLPPIDLALVPSAFLADTTEVEVTLSRFDHESLQAAPAEAPAAIAAREIARRFLDHPVPALEHKRPAEAAADPALRPRLAALVKAHLRRHDRSNLQEGRTDDLNWMIRELGLDELDLPPPPPRQAPARSRSEVPFRPPAPPLPRAPLTAQQVKARRRRVTRQLPTQVDALEELEASGSTLLTLLDEVLLQDHSEEALELIEEIAVEAWFALVPVGFQAPRPPPESARHARIAVANRLRRYRIEESEEDLLEAICDEPALLRSLLHEALERWPEEEVPSGPTSGTAALTVSLAVLINLMVDALGRADDGPGEGSTVPFRPER